MNKPKRSTHTYQGAPDTVIRHKQQERKIARILWAMFAIAMIGLFGYRQRDTIADASIRTAQALTSMRNAVVIALTPDPKEEDWRRSLSFNDSQFGLNGTMEVYLDESSEGCFQLDDGWDVVYDPREPECRSLNDCTAFCADGTDGICTHGGPNKADHCICVKELQEEIRKVLQGE